MDYKHASQHDLEDHVLRMSIAWVDLMSAGFAFETLIGHPDYRVLLSSDRAALVEAAVVAYGRAFDHSRGRGLGPEWSDYANQAWQDEHGELIEYRHTFVGHSDLDPRTVTIETDDSTRGWSSRVNLPVYMPGRAETALDMCKDLHFRLRRELDDALAEMIRRERDGGPSDAPLKMTLPH